MKRVKRRKLSVYEDYYDFYDLNFYLRATPKVSKTGRKEYRVTIREYDPDYHVASYNPILAPGIFGNTPQIVFGKAKKYIQSIYTPDPEWVRLDKLHENFLRRLEYEETKKKKPYVPSKTKSERG